MESFSREVAENDNNLRRMCFPRQLGTNICKYSLNQNTEIPSRRYPLQITSDFFWGNLFQFLERASL